jgi:hypothetical protein
LEYLQGLKSGVGEFVGGVGTTLADRAKAAGGLAYEALTSDPNISRMNTAEFSEAAANRQTPRLDQAARDIGAIGRAIVTQPVQTAKAVVVDPVVNAFESPRAMGQFAGEFVNPLRIAAALRKTAPIAELDVYHGTPHKYAPTEANPLGEFDASKIGTGEGAQAYGHGVYLAETPEVAKSYKTAGVDKNDPAFVSTARQYAQDPLFGETLAEKLVTLRRDPNDQFGQKAADYLEKNYDVLRNQGGSLYKADLPDEMIDRMLDWDKPLSEQHPEVQRIIGEEIKRIGGSAHTGERAYRELMFEARMGGKKSASGVMKSNIEAVEASKRLQELGIPGIRYLDAGSRDGGSGTRNFVVFPGEEKKVRILERNGQPAPERIAQALEEIKPVTTAVEIPEALHGSPVRGLTELSPSKAMEVRGTTWFSDNADIADQYTFPREYGEILFDAEPGEIYKAGLSFKNPLTVDFGGKVGDAMELSKLAEQAKKKGYDGLIVQNVDDSIDSSKVLGTSYAVFDRNQIKLKK